MGIARGKGIQDKLMNHRYPDGRTMHEAIEAEDSYQLIIPGQAPYWCPGLAGIDELTISTRKAFPDLHGTFKVERVLKGSSIGCMIVEDAGSITI